jgi:hypothetical protein
MTSVLQILVAWQSVSPFEKLIAKTAGHCSAIPEWAEINILLSIPSE